MRYVTENHFGSMGDKIREIGLNNSMAKKTENKLIK